jgi:uncharacterized OB-fold protein
MVTPLSDLDVEGREDVVTRDGSVFLVGARSNSSGVETFPARTICPETGSRDMERAEFGPDAVLYSYATVHVSAAREVPYTLGYIDFPSGLRALAHVRAPEDALRCDLAVTLRTDMNGAWWVEPGGAGT